MTRTPHRRDAVIAPGSPEGLDIGLNDKEIPGGQQHLANAPVPRHAPLPVSHAPYYGGIMAHGVDAPPEDPGASWKRLAAPGGKSVADLAGGHGMTTGALILAARESAGEDGGLTRSEADEFARQIAQGTGQPLDAGLVYVIPLHGALGRITAAFHARPAAAATRTDTAEQRKRPDPVPVYLVQEGVGPKPLRKLATRRILVPAAGNQPVLLAPTDPDRVAVHLLNEDTANLVRIADNLSQLTNSQGQISAAVLPAVTNTYRSLATQDRIYAIADAAAGCYVSVILEFAQAGAG